MKLGYVPRFVRNFLLLKTNVGIAPTNCWDKFRVAADGASQFLAIAE